MRGKVRSLLTGAFHTDFGKKIKWMYMKVIVLPAVVSLYFFLNWFGKVPLPITEPLTEYVELRKGINWVSIGAGYKYSQSEY